MHRIALLLIIITISACSLVDKRSYEPAYVLVEDVTLETAPEQGYASHNIKDVWMYASDTLLGVFPLPARVPVIVDGDKTRFTAFAGIRNDGISALPFIYQMINREEEVVEIAAGETYKMDLNFRYSPNAKFAFVEGFEGGHKFTFDGDDDPETTLESSREGAKYGSYTGRIVLDTAHHTISTGYHKAITTEELNRSDAYLELDYKTEVPILVSVALVDKGVLTIKDKIYIKESDSWNKIYIDLTRELNSVSLDSYRVIFSASIKGTGKSKAEIYMDNIKMVHF